MKLHFKRKGSGPPLIVLHGLLGLLDNWKTLADVLAEHFEVYLVDQRNHGRSPHDSVHTYDAMVDDIYEFIDENSLSGVCLIGHSMGGKTAMSFAKKHPELMEKLVVVDIAPKAYPIHHEDILVGIEAIDFDIVQSRSEAEEVLLRYVTESRTRQFVLKNLYWVERGRLGWRFNLEAIQNHLSEMGEASKNDSFNKPTLFVRGTNSEYIAEADYENIKAMFPKAEIISIEGAGHWVHADKPEEFLEAMLAFLR